MKITLHPTEPKYINKKLNLVFRYVVSGTTEELADFKAVKGENYREGKNKEPLFFTTRGIGQTGILRKTTDGKDYVIDDTEAAMFQSLASQYGADYAKLKMHNMLPENQTIPVEEKK
jgi:hypothetical protein